MSEIYENYDVNEVEGIGEGTENSGSGLSLSDKAKYGGIGGLIVLGIFGVVHLAKKHKAKKAEAQEDEEPTVKKPGKLDEAKKIFKKKLGKSQEKDEKTEE